MRHPMRAPLVLSIAAMVLIGAGTALAQVPDDVVLAQGILSQVQDRALRRTLLDRFRRGKIDLKGLQEAAGGGAPMAPVSTPAVKSDPDRPLGATLHGDATTFRVLALRAFSMSVHTFREPKGGKGVETPMVKAEDGIWEATVKGAGAGTYYDFTCDGPQGAGEKFDRDRHLSDPYAKSNVASDGRSIVIDNAFDWGSTASHRPPAIPDVVVYELHLKDWTAHASSGVTDPKKQGKYLGLTEPKLLDHLVELGVNTVELLPIHEFDNHAALPATSTTGAT